MASPTKRLQGKVALITGSSSGLGEAFALMFASEGAHVSLTGRNQKELERVTNACKQFPGVKAIFTAGDISADDFRKKLVENTVSSLGKIDILVNNAGVTGVYGGSIVNPNYEDFDLVLNVNLRAVYHLCGLVAPHIVKTKGNIINISSTAGIKQYHPITPYCVSKAGLDMLTRCLAAELGPLGVRVNGVNPGDFKTNIWRSIPAEEVDQLYDSFKDAYPLGRIGELDELSKFVTFLASDDASFVTGINCPVDGGYLLK
jgi:NAD(P)-dependent dehydrogenase (short-subunit alcohol dehydrogenase family)